MAGRALGTAALSGAAGPELAAFWQGAAADAARVELGQLSARAIRLLPGLDAGGAALDRYADALEHAQLRAGALRRKVADARAEHARAVAAAPVGALDPTAETLLVERVDRELDETLRLIQRSYGRVLDELTDAGTACARALARAAMDVGGGPGRGPGAVRDGVLAGMELAGGQIRIASERPVGHVPEREPDSWWEGARDAVGGAAAWTYNHTAVPVVNGAADVAQAVVEHPEDLVEMALGVGAMVIGAGGEVVGAGLDATVIGAPAGIALNVAAAGLIVTGAAATAHGAGNLANHALQNDNRLLNEASGPAPTSTPARGNPGDPLPESVRPNVAGSTWKGRVSDTGKGDVWQAPDFVGVSRDANSVRIMDPTWRYTNVYVRFYDEKGRPLTLDGIPGPNKHESTHIPIRPDGTYDIPKGWAP